MDKQQKANIRSMSLFSKIVVLLVFVILMVSAIAYFYRNEPNIKMMTMHALAKEFDESVTNAHWQWQAEGRPQIVMLVQYASQLGDENALLETDRRPIMMSHLGWPRAEPNEKGCARIWQMVLNTPLEVEGFRVYAEYFDGVQSSDSALQAKCRYRLSIGPYFEYHIYTGQVSKVED